MIKTSILTSITLVLTFNAVSLEAVAQDSNMRDAQTGMTYEQAVEYNRLSIQSNKLLEQNDWVGDRPILEQLCKLYSKQDHNLAGAHCNLAIACMHMGDMKEALREFQSAFAMDPHDASTARSFASYYAELGDTENAKLWLQKSIDIAQPAETDLISEAKSTLATLSKPGAKPGTGDKNSPDYLSDLFNGKGARWPSDKVPIKVYFEPVSGVPHYRTEFKSVLEAAFNQWTSATGGRLLWIEVPSANNADIECVWQESPGDAVSEEGGMQPEAHAASDGTWILEHATLTLFALSKDIYSLSTNPVTHLSQRDTTELMPLSEKEAQGKCLHEVGHALGIYGHSSNPDDVMFYITTITPATQLTQRDRNTIMRLYQSYPVRVSTKE